MEVAKHNRGLHQDQHDNALALMREANQHQLKMKTALVDTVSGTPAKSLAMLVSGMGEASGGAGLLTGALGKAALGLAGFAGLAIGAGIAAYKFGLWSCVQQGPPSGVMCVEEGPLIPAG